MTKLIKVSVRNLVEFVLRSGDIDNSFRSMSRALEGTKAHQRVQSSYGDEYRSEVFLKHSVYYENFLVELQGRADGIFTLPDEIIIDEIKSTTKKLEDIEDNNELHWAQAKCYAYIYCEDENLQSISVQITYFHIESEEKKIFKKTYTKDQLEKYFYSLTDKYIKWASTTFYWSQTRDNSILDLSFPFPEYREGQRELAVAAYKTIKEGRKLFTKAPTGIGKTISTLFPGIKAMGEGEASKIFYLTAKTITREVPIETMKLLKDRGLRAKTIVITAKDKICLNEETKCNPRDCIYAKGHFDRVNDAIMDIFENEDLITREVAIKYSEKHKVCPFEFVLDISLWADVIVADYNYVFDPQVYLKRFFEGMAENYIFLIDEAHNLVDRSREMFSAEINTSDFTKVIDIFRDKYPTIYNSLNRCLYIMGKIKVDLEVRKEYYQKEEIVDLHYPFKKAITILEPWLLEEKKHENYEEVLELYFNLIKYIKISDLYDQHYVVYIREENEDLIFKLYCIDSSYLLKEAMLRGKSSILFSATLSPLDYYKDLLGGNSKDYEIGLSSPFPRENLCLMIGDNISTKYRDRERTYLDVVVYIERFIKEKKGNYLLFFPSYKYMNKIYEILTERNPYLNVMLQESNMSEVDREDFLLSFEKEDDLTAFAVMGGIFSEGIDLTGENLIGAVVVGVGLPQICFERNIIKDYFNHNRGQGFEYAYIYPGMNKVLQSAGRVIRSPEDRGAILLIDDRYRSRKYRSLFPREWNRYKSIRNKEDLEKELKDFWRN